MLYFNVGSKATADKNHTSVAGVAAKKERLICETAKLAVSGNGGVAKVEELNGLKHELAPMFLEMVVELIAAGQLALHIMCPSSNGEAGCLVWAEPKTAKIGDGRIVVEATATRISVFQNIAA
jgi:hypothetical protein